MRARRITTAALLALSFAAGGCSLLSEYRTVSQEDVLNDRGHVIGRREVLRQRSEELTRVALYTPLLDESGRVIGYEERTRSGAIIRDLRGRHVGNRYVDLRSRGTNPTNRGVTIVFRPLEAERVSLAAAPASPGTIRLAQAREVR